MANLDAVTKEIEAWIKEHGNARNALNVALSRLESQRALIDQLTSEIRQLRYELWDLREQTEDRE